MSDEEILKCVSIEGSYHHSVTKSVFLDFFVLTLSALTPNKFFRTAGSQRELLGFDFDLYQQSDSWVRSANATSVLCRPPEYL